MTDVASLDHAGLDALVNAAEQGDACLRVELDGGRPRTKFGLAAGLLVTVLTGCATPSSSTALVDPVDEFMNGETANDGAVIAGQVVVWGVEPNSQPRVLLRSKLFEDRLEQLVDERGFYKFDGLAPGEYTIEAHVEDLVRSTVALVSERQRLRADFTLYPEGSGIRLGMGSAPTPCEPVVPTLPVEVMDY